MVSSPSLLMRQLARRREDYGFDEPVWPLSSAKHSAM
jgi:hypothetical protein